MKVTITRLYKFDPVTGEHSPVHVTFAGYDKHNREVATHELSGKVGDLYRMGEHTFDFNNPDVVRVDATSIQPFTAFAWSAA